MNSNNKADAQMKAIKTSIDLQSKLGNTGRDALERIIKSQQELIVKQQAIIDNLSDIVKDQGEDIEGHKKTIEQMKADRANELEDMAVKNLNRMVFSD